MKNVIIVIIAALTLASCSTADKVSRDERRREKAGIVAESIESGRYRVGVRTAYPARGGAVQVTGDYGLRISGVALRCLTEADVGLTSRLLWRNTR